MGGIVLSSIFDISLHDNRTHTCIKIQLNSIYAICWKINVKENIAVYLHIQYDLRRLHNRESMWSHDKHALEDSLTIDSIDVCHIPYKDKTLISCREFLMIKPVLQYAYTYIHIHESRICNTTLQLLKTFNNHKS